MNEQHISAHVICCNDSVEAVFIGDVENAEIEKERLCELDYVKQLSRHSAKVSRREYKQIYFWHIHTVPVIPQQTKENI